LRIKEQETSLTLHEHDDDDDDERLKTLYGWIDVMLTNIIK